MNSTTTVAAVARSHSSSATDHSSIIQAWMDSSSSITTTCTSPPSFGPQPIDLLPPPRASKSKAPKLSTSGWFHGKISREQAEDLLQPRVDGLYLVRESTNYPGDYTLCVCCGGRVEHYRVLVKEERYTIDEEEWFWSLGELIEHYGADADGLCTTLGQALPKAAGGGEDVKNQGFLATLDAKALADGGWTIPRRDIQLLDSLGKGEFGEVRLGLLAGVKVAVKILKDSSPAAEKFLAEASLMTSLKHPNLVRMLGVVLDGGIHLVTEYMSKGSLLDYLRSRGRLHVTPRDQIQFAHDTSLGMEYLEAKKVVHRDLAARNVLISEEGTAKVADFGLAWRETVGAAEEDLAGKLPIKWTAPEALKKNKFSNKSDMWSFGVLLWEVYSFGRVPYPRIPLSDVLRKVQHGYTMENPEGCPLAIYDLMRRSWHLNPDSRPTFSEVQVLLAALRANCPAPPATIGSPSASPTS